MLSELVVETFEMDLVPIRGWKQAARGSDKHNSSRVEGARDLRNCGCQPTLAIRGGASRQRLKQQFVHVTRPRSGIARPH